MKSSTKRIKEALEVIAYYGNVDGAHHKQFALDQIARILTGTEEKYYEWVSQFMEEDEDGRMVTYWDEGIG